MKIVIVKEFKTKVGLKGFIVAHPSGHLNGYVEAPESLKNAPYHEIHHEVDVHGGITFGADVLPVDDYENSPIVFGFDTNHLGDRPDPDRAVKYGCLDPKNPKDKSFYDSVKGSLGIFDGTVKDEEYVKEEIEKLAKQIKEISGKWKDEDSLKWDT